MRAVAGGSPSLSPTGASVAPCARRAHGRGARRARPVSATPVQGAERAFEEVMAATMLRRSSLIESRTAKPSYFPRSPVVPSTQGRAPGRRKRLVKSL
jgi:hypothetical protein